jgi:hypothetical protein
VQVLQGREARVTEGRDLRRGGVQLPRRGRRDRGNRHESDRPLLRQPGQREAPDAELLSLGIDSDDLAQPSELSKQVYCRSSDELYGLLQNELNNAPGSKNALAMIDRFGNLLAVGVDRPAESPIATAMMNVVPGYSDWAFEQLQEAALTVEYSPAVSSIDQLRATPADKYPSPVNRNTFIDLKAPTRYLSNQKDSHGTPTWRGGATGGPDIQMDRVEHRQGRCPCPEPSRSGIRV